MGCCCSTEILEPDIENKISTIKNPIRYTFCKRKKIIITNNSKVNASFAITVGCITNISSLSVDKLGSISFDKTGTDKVQKFKILSMKPRTVRIHSNYINITVYLHINDKWYPLWINREFNQLDDISIHNYHIEEALIGNMFEGIDE